MDDRVRGEQPLPLSIPRIVSPRTPRGARPAQRWAAYLAVSAAVMVDGSYRVHLIRKDATGAHVITTLLDSGDNGRATNKWLVEQLDRAADSLVLDIRHTGQLPS